MYYILWWERWDLRVGLYEQIGEAFDECFPFRFSLTVDRFYFVVNVGNGTYRRETPPFSLNLEDTLEFSVIPDCVFCALPLAVVKCRIL